MSHKRFASAPDHPAKRYKADPYAGYYGQPADAYPAYGAPPETLYQGGGGGGYPPYGGGAYPAAPSHDAYGGGQSWSAPRNRDNNNNPPCDTLYVGNLLPTVSEQEIRTIMQGAPGFVDMTFTVKQSGARPTALCFVQFSDVASAAGAMEAYSNVTLTTNGALGAMRLSYSKNRLNASSR